MLILHDGRKLKKITKKQQRRKRIIGRKKQLLKLLDDKWEVIKTLNKEVVKHNEFLKQLHAYYSILKTQGITGQHVLDFIEHYMKENKLEG